MEYWKEAFGVADIILENSWTLWIVYISFFILALAVHKKGNRTRRIAGNVMLGAALPGVFISAHCLGLFIYAMIKVYQIASSGEYSIISDSPVVRSINDAGQAIPITYLTVSLLLYLIVALVAVICGIVILAKRAGKAPGIITLLYGLGLIGYDCWFFGAMMMFFAS